MRWDRNQEGRDERYSLGVANFKKLLESQKLKCHVGLSRSDKFTKDGTGTSSTRRGTMATAMSASSGVRVPVGTGRVSRCVAVGRVVRNRVRAVEGGDVQIDSTKTKTKVPPVSRDSSRRALLFGAAAYVAASPLPNADAADVGSVSLGSSAVMEPLKPLGEYKDALKRADAELAEIALALSVESGENGASVSSKTNDDFDDPELDIAVPLSGDTRTMLKKKLHSGELGRFWVNARGSDRYLAGARSSFARDREDLWKLIPEKAGPLGRALQPDFDNPDDPLCLIYSCVNDPKAPPSIDTLYALKLLDEGLSTKGVTARGLLGNARDARDKLAVYRALVEQEADDSLVDSEWRNPAPKKGWGWVGI